AARGQRLSSRAATRNLSTSRCSVFAGGMHTRRVSPENHSTDRPESAPEPEPGEVVGAIADGDDLEEIAAQVEQPAKVMRIGTMIKQLLEEVRSAPLDDAGRRRLREIHESSIHELELGLSADLRDELERLTIPFGGDTPSEAELRVAQAQ